MLSEFAFTPSIFDESVHPDKDAWRDQLRHLNSTMFPKTSAWPIVVSDLHAASWFAQAEKLVDSISDHRVKSCCRELLKCIKKMLVIRPAIGNWPDDDSDWCREALATHNVEPIDRIISDRSTKLSLSDEFCIVRCLDEVEEGGFWRGLAGAKPLPMLISEQAKALRKMCVHSQWIAFINPHGLASEEKFTFHLLEVVLQRDPSFGSINIELHVQKPGIKDENEAAQSKDRIANYVNGHIGSKVTGKNSIKLFFWDKLLDRSLIAGAYTSDENHERRMKPRWGVSMNHIARFNESDAAPTDWKLLNSESVGDKFRRFVAEDAPGKIAQSTISAD